jgi:mannosylglycoprotein endo-beta-mannosidase
MKLKQSITLVVCCQNAWVALLLLHSHVASNVRLEANDPYKLKSIPSTVRKELHQGWTACRSSSVNDPALGCVENNQRPGVGSAFVVLNVTQLPTTVLAVLLDNHQIAEAPHITMENLYYSQNLAQIPDISVTGRDYYTLLYQIEIPSIVTGDPTSAPGATKCPPMRRIVEFSGINYRATVWCNGVLLKNRQSAITTSFLDAPPNATLDGMFVRHRYDISACVNRSSTSALLVVQIDPPDHPGYPVLGQQGGSHDLAKDGAVPQYMLGWDWCSSMPDRAAGFFGSVTLADSYQNGKLTLQDPAIQTVAMEQCFWKKPEVWACGVVSLRILVRIESSPLKWSFSDPVIILKVISDWGEEWLLSLDEIGVAVSQNGFIDIQRDFVVESPEEISFWWPHGVGIDDYAHLHTFRILLQVDDIHCDSATVAVGIRKIDVFIPDWNNGQLFRINDHDVYLVGGNWIGTDQALRFSASEQRYCEEVLLHHHAGLNLIRVWGGGVAERDQFYDCADRFGVLVYQEFWMTGDNNGRWAGNFSWPLDYGSYLSNVEDTVKRLRRHPSLLLYGGCNECLSPRTSPWAPNPPRVIDDGIGRLIQQFDPGRFYISSSMGGVRICLRVNPWNASFMFTYIQLTAK